MHMRRTLRRGFLLDFQGTSCFFSFLLCGFSSFKKKYLSWEMGHGIRKWFTNWEVKSEGREEKGGGGGEKNKQMYKCFRSCCLECNRWRKLWIACMPGLFARSDRSSWRRSSTRKPRWNRSSSFLLRWWNIATVGRFRSTFHQNVNLSTNRNDESVFSLLPPIFRKKISSCTHNDK